MISQMRLLLIGNFEFHGDFVIVVFFFFWGGGVGGLLVDEHFGFVQDSERACT